MSKSKYKSVEFKQVDWTELSKRIEGERVVLAVDVAKEVFVATFLTADQRGLLTFSWHHPQETGLGKGPGMARAQQFQLRGQCQVGVGGGCGVTIVDRVDRVDPVDGVDSG